MKACVKLMKSEVNEETVKRLLIELQNYKEEMKVANKQDEITKKNSYHDQAYATIVSSLHEVEALAEKKINEAEKRVSQCLGKQKKIESENRRMALKIEELERLLYDTEKENKMYNEKQSSNNLNKTKKNQKQILINIFQ
jgi:hypothetical protein